MELQELRLPDLCGPTKLDRLAWLIGISNTSSWLLPGHAAAGPAHGQIRIEGITRDHFGSLILNLSLEKAVMFTELCAREPQ